MTWPYGDPPEPQIQADAPTWQCPGGQCQCHPVEEGSGEEALSIVLCAHDGARMPGAVCRVHHAGRLLHEDVLTADGDGRVEVIVPRVPATLLVEWAPAGAPKDPRYPYRTRYFSDLGAESRQSGRRRLANLGFWKERTLEDNVREFQHRYAHPLQTGDLRDIEAELTLYHDTGCPPITHDVDPGPGAFPFDEGSGDTASFTAAPSKAKSGPGDKAPPPTPQPPLPPAANQGSVKVPSPAVEVDILVDWGRGRAGGGGQPSSSFWLNPTAVPVAVGIVDTLADAWATNPPVAATVTRASSTSVVASGLRGPALVRVDFDLQVTIDGTTKTVLAFHQLYTLFADGDLVPSRFAFADFSYAKVTGKPPIRGKGQGTNVVGGLRRGGGAHPLTSAGSDLLPPNRPPKGPLPKGAVPRRTKRIFINAEMVDATELWWALHGQGDADRYLHPALAARSDHLRILAWTSGKLPMIWFAVVPDAALAKTATSAADIVFFRPPPGANSFTHKPDLAGFKDEKHHVSKSGKVSTMWMLARFLLSSQPIASLRTAGVTDASILESFSDQIQPTTARTGSGAVDPRLPSPHISGFVQAFRACGLERSLGRSGAPHVLFLPLASENDGYPGAVRPGLKGVVETAMLCLWNQCAVARDIPVALFSTTLDGPDPPKPQKPDVAARALWLAGHSAGNLSLGAALSGNGADVERALSFAATHHVGTIDNVITNLTMAATARKAAGKSIDAVVVTAPDLTSTWLPPPGAHGYTGIPTIRGVSMDVGMAKRFLQSGASVTFLPPFDQQLAHFTLRPAKGMVPVLRNLVGAWTDAEVDEAAGSPHGWQFLFFHEYPVHGGDSSSPFFLQALGTPNPLTTIPTKLPP